MDDPNMAAAPVDPNSGQPVVAPAQPVDTAATTTPNAQVAANALNSAPLDPPAAPADTSVGAPVPPPTTPDPATPVSTDPLAAPVTPDPSAPIDPNAPQQ